MTNSSTTTSNTVGELLNRTRVLRRARTLPHAVALGYETGLLGPPPGGSGTGQDDHRPFDPEGPGREQAADRSDAAARFRGRS
ncbi:hypothetical protein DBP19_36600 [Streptomyces sp. CS090A]|nr:hypothetical protein DBP19_36600 [Streptomyces sp. CS090A]